MIITISREFGSGGRELGKRLSNVLEIPCYDKEIIQMIAEKQGFDEQYVSHISCLVYTSPTRRGGLLSRGPNSA